jgi:hypothetical protein
MDGVRFAAEVGRRVAGRELHLVMQVAVSNLAADMSVHVMADGEPGSPSLGETRISGAARVGNLLRLINAAATLNAELILLGQRGHGQQCCRKQ